MIISVNLKIIFSTSIHNLVAVSILKFNVSPVLLKLIEQRVSLIYCWIIVKTLVAKVLGPLVVYDGRRALVPGDLRFFPTYLFYQFARCQCRMGLQL